MPGNCGTGIGNQPICLESDAVVLASSNAAGETVTVTATAGVGLSINGVVLQYAAAGTDNWTTLNAAVTPFGPSLYRATLSYGSFPTGSGTYSLRAVVTDSGGNTGYSPVRPDIVAVNDFAGETYVALLSPGPVLSATVNLIAAPWRDNFASNQPDTVTFEVSPAGANHWTQIGTVPQEVDNQGQPVLVTPTGVTSLNGMPAYTTPFATTSVPDGRYDFRVVAQDAAGDVYIVNLVTNVLVDNTPPAVTLQSPGTSIGGIKSLSASAQDSGSGVSSVEFQYAPAGSGTWTTISLVATTPYSVSFDTRGLQNGFYDFRALATDVAGNVGVSGVVSHVSVSNSGQIVNPDALTVTDYVVPASDVSLLGAIAGSSDGETWAIGYTTAPPAIVNGAQLEYTAHDGPQLVLLRFTTTTGWEIADVLRNGDGSSFAITGNVTNDSIYAIGQMAATGEAWVVVSQLVGGVSQSTLFHRLPGGEFLADASAADASATNPTLQTPANTLAAPVLTVIASGSGAAYGLLINPAQVRTSAGGLNYALLANGSWTAQSANVPAGAGSLLLQSASLTGPGTGWGIFSRSSGAPLIGSFNGGAWQYVSTLGLDALDLTGSFAGVASSFGNLQITAASDGVWIGVTEAVPGRGAASIVALYSPSEQRVVGSWCGLAVFGLSRECSQQLSPIDPAAVPTAVFETSSGPIAVALQGGFIDIYAYGRWSSVAAPGFTSRLPAGTPLTPLFESQNSGWLSGTNALGLITVTAPTAPLAPWPQPNQHTLLAIAIPPAGASISTSGAVAVGLNGAALHFDSAQGWLSDPVPAAARSVNLLGVAFSGTSAVAVGGFGVIIVWNGTSWSLDPQSSVLTQNQLNGVAFAPDGEGWAVGTFGTILHFDGTTWSIEPIDAADSGTDVTSVTVSGSQVFAIAGGNLITREPNGSWQRVDSSQLPAAPPITPGSLTLVSGLPDGGLIVAGKSVLIQRSNGSSPLEYAPQPINGTAVALTAFRDTSGRLLAYVSVAPPVTTGGAGVGAAAFPSGDGELLVETAAGGWRDLSEDQYPATTVSGDGAPEPNPVLAVAVGAGGTSAWAVGGYAGTVTAAGLGSGQPLQGTPAGWQTSSIWRYDAGGSATSPAVGQNQVILTAGEGVVSFAFFSSLLCEYQCSSVSDAQPNANLAQAAAEISAYSQQPGGPLFAMLGGNAVGPVQPAGYTSGNGAVDLANLHNNLSLLGNVPLYAAYGPLDAIPTSANPSQPWDNTFAQSPAPFGLGQSANEVTPISSGGASGAVHHYYSFEASEDGGTVFVIVLDNSAGSLEASSPGQSAWLGGQLVVAQAAGLPIVVVCSEPLDAGLGAVAASDGTQLATELANAGVLAVFSTSGGTSEADRVDMVPYSLTPGPLQIPEYEGAALGYQQPQNNGVVWYNVQIDTVARSVSVKAIPVVQSLALESIDGLTVARSSTLSFLGIGKRPPGTLAANGDGYSNYVSIPSTSCSGCIGPSYKFTSSVPGIGDFVVPSAPGSQLPLLNAQGQAIPSSSSGLFCAFNEGQTTVTLTSGLQSVSEVVTVLPGGFGSPCGTAVYGPDQHVIQIPGQTLFTSPPPSNGTAPPPPAPIVTINLPLLPPPPPPLPVPTVPPSPAAPPLPLQSIPATPLPPALPLVPIVILPAVVVPPIPPPVTPIPPGGATAQAAARREEKARKRAQQSAFVTRPSGVSAVDWFYPAVGAVGLLTIMLIANGMRPGPGKRAALAELWENEPRRRRRPNRR